MYAVLPLTVFSDVQEEAMERLIVMIVRTGMTFITVLAVLFVLPGSTFATGLTEEGSELSVTIDGARTTLDSVIIRPDDGQRHPLLILNHGAPRKAEDRDTMNPYSMRFQARQFARRGWTVISFMRRGYGHSESGYVESSGKCVSPDYVKSGRRSADDIRAVIQTMRNHPYVDNSRIVSVGRSAGGFATVALTADPPPGLVAAVSFAGGRGSTKPDEVCDPERLVNAFTVFGKTSRIPMLWVYAENDHYFGPRLARRFHNAFSEAGGQAEFIAADAFGEDGHALFSEQGFPIWSKLVDDFLARNKLTLVDQLVPSFDLAKVRFPQGLNAHGREAFLKFLDSSDHRAFVMSRNGHYGWRSGQRSVGKAIEDAMRHCSKNNRERCFVVMGDEKYQD